MFNINGVDSLKGGTVDSYNDHRIAMMASIARLVSKEDIIINGAEAVNKSYKTFYKDYEQLGASVCKVIAK